MDLELAAAGTEFSAGSASKTALANLFDGDKWMIVYNAINGVLHWDFVGVFNVICADNK